MQVLSGYSRKSLFSALRFCLTGTNKTYSVTGKEEKEGESPKAENIKVIRDRALRHEWHISELRTNNGTVYPPTTIIIKRKNEKISWKTPDDEVGTPIPIPEEFNARTIFLHLRDNCEIVDLADDGTPTFGEPYHKWNVDGIEVIFHRFSKELVLQLRSEREINHRMLLLEVAKPDSRCSEYTKKLFVQHVVYNESSFSNFKDNTYNGPTTTREECAAFLKDFTITKIEKNPYDGRWEIYLLPQSKNSRFNEKVKVSKFCWAVTFVAEGLHAVIIIEGLDDNGKYFMHKVDFTGAKLRSKLHPKDLKFHQRSQIWTVSKEKVIEMLNAIEKEKSAGKLPEFFIAGKKSIIGGGAHNCTTWAKEKLKLLDIDLDTLEGKILGVFFTAAPNFTHNPDYYKYDHVNNFL